MNYRVAGLTLAVILSLPIALHAQSSRQPDASTRVDLPMPDWRKREMALIATVRGVQQGDVEAQRRFDQLLTEFEHAPFTKTPLENLELLAVFYLPKDGVEKCFSLIVANQVLGWYDALRFASASGRTELVSNTGFFKGPYVVSKTGPAMAKWLAEQPDKVSQAFSQGILFAQRFRETPGYDHRWPQSFGLERIACATEGKCDRPEGLPTDQWDSAWAKANQQVAEYYQIGKAPANTGAAK